MFYLVYDPCAWALVNWLNLAAYALEHGDTKSTSGLQLYAYMTLVMRKHAFCLCENKPQISFAVTAKLISAFVFATRIVQILYFLNPKFQGSPSSVAAQPGLCRTWSETPKTGFLTTRLILFRPHWTTLKLGLTGAYINFSFSL